MMLKLKLQYFGHLMRTTDSLERSLMLGEIEGRRRRGHQRMRWLDGITEAVDVSFGRWWGSERLGVLQSMGSQSRTGLGSWAAASVGALQCVLVSAVEHGGLAVCTCVPSSWTSSRPPLSWPSGAQHWAPCSLSVFTWSCICVKPSVPMYPPFPPPLGPHVLYVFICFCPGAKFIWTGENHVPQCSLQHSLG